MAPISRMDHVFSDDCCHPFSHHVPRPARRTNLRPRETIVSKSEITAEMKYSVFSQVHALHFDALPRSLLHDRRRPRRSDEQFNIEASAGGDVHSHVLLVWLVLWGEAFQQVDLLKITKENVNINNNR